MSPSSPRFRVRWHAIFIAALTLGLLWLFVRDIDPAAAWQAITHAHPLWILGAAAITLQTYVIRAWRWQVLLRPIGRARFSSAFRCTVLGFTASFLLPARIGEVLRPYLLARREQFNVASTFASVVVERLMDLVTVLLLFGLAIPVSGVAVGGEVRAAGAALAGVAVFVTLLLVLLAGHPERLGRTADRLGRRLPTRVSGAVTHFVRTFAEGLKIMRSPGHLLGAFVWSLPLWTSIALGIWMTSRAFDLTLPFVGSFLVVGYLTVGISAPTPGGTGAFHFFYKLAMTTLFGASESTAAAAAFVLHLISFVPVTLLGLTFMWQDGLTLGGLKDLKEEAKGKSQ